FFAAHIGEPYAAPNPPTSPLLQLGFGQAFSRYQDLDATTVPNCYKTYNSQWAEVGYFLKANGALAGGATPLSALYRQQLLAVPESALLNWPGVVETNMAQFYTQVSCLPNPKNPAPPAKQYLY